FQYDSYITYALACDTTLFDLSFINGSLQATDGLSWKWYCNDTLLANETNKDLIPVRNGYYVVAVEQESGCFQWSEPYIYPPEATPPTIKVFPNPSYENVTILLPPDMKYCGLFDITGKCIAEVVPAETITLNVSHLASGIYFVKAGNPGLYLSTKMIIM
ncbi:MAG: T9SS type A sorting domain-containing protein, partial [Chitinophagales bacterium]